VEAYCGQRFVETDDPSSISESYRRLLRQVFSDDDLAHALNHKGLEVAIVATRLRGTAGASSVRRTLLVAAVLNTLSPRAPKVFFTRTLFHTSAGDPSGSPSLLQEFQGHRCSLTTANVRDVALASGTVPVYMAPVRDIVGAPDGSYVDGALCDYHWNQQLDARGGLAILFLHQRRIIPGWLDKHVPWRRVAGRAVSDVLLVYPDPEFVRSLPGGRVPSRDDFFAYVREPERRIAMWHDVVRRSGELGAKFLEDAASGAIASRAQPI
jgi:hypothetical protein